VGSAGVFLRNLASVRFLVAAEKTSRGLLLGAIAAGLLSAGDAAAIHLVCKSPSATVPCRIWLVPAEATRPVVELAGGRKASVEPGRYFLRAESPQGVLPAPAAVVVVPGESEKGEPDEVLLRPGARVEVPDGLVGEAGAVHLLSLDSGAIETLFLAQRRFTLEPAGRAIAVGLAGPGLVAGVTAPFEVPGSGAVKVPPLQNPAPGTGHVVVSWAYPEGSARPDDGLTPLLRSGERTLEASESRFDRDRLHWAVYYDVPAGRWSAVVRSRRWRSTPREIEVIDRRTSFPDPVPLLRKAELTLGLERSGDLADEPFDVTVYRVPADECEPARRRGHLSPALDEERAEVLDRQRSVRGEARVPGVDPGCVAVAFECSGRRTHVVEEVGDEDLAIVGKLAPIHVTGTLRWSGKGGPGSLRFTHLNDGTVEDEAEADRDGAYRATVWQAGFFSVRIAPADGGPPATKRLRVPPGIESVEADFDLPSETFRFRVVDATSNEPVPGAVACCIPGLEEELARPAADADGRLAFRIPRPERERTAEDPVRLPLRFSAEGYEPSNLEIDPLRPPAGEEVVRLRKEDDRSRFFALLPDGSPAAGASVFLAPAGVASDDVARTAVVACDRAGECRLGKVYPESQSLAIVHAAAGITTATLGEISRTGTVRLLPRAGGFELRVVRGPQSLGRLLSLSVVLNGREVPVAALQTALLIGGAPVGGGAQVAPGGPPEALLRATLLPPGGVRVGILARVPGSSGPAEIVSPARDVWVPGDAPAEIQLP